MSYEKMFFIAGMPRSGSTLLSSILSQNNNICAEGHSGLCQLMWDMHSSFEGNAKSFIVANNKQYLQQKIISNIPHQYYEQNKRKYVFDKFRLWIAQPNLDLIHKYIDDDPKIIVLVRDMKEVISSYLRIYPALLDDYDIFSPDNHFMISVNSVLYAKNNFSDKFIFISYDDLVLNTKKTMSNIYDYLKITNYEHQFEEIKNIYPENDIDGYGIPGLHDIRSTIEKNKSKIILDKLIIDKCESINELIFKE